MTHYCSVTMVSFCVFVVCAALLATSFGESNQSTGNYCPQSGIDSASANDRTLLGGKADSMVYYNSHDLLPPTVIISVLVRNKAHSLPHFLGHLELLNYPRSRVGLHIRLDHTRDNSDVILEEWMNKWEEQYHFIYYDVELNFTEYRNQTNDFDWTPERTQHVLTERQKALDYARLHWADYLFMLDCDILLINRNTLQDLMSSQKTIISPMLNSTTELKGFSNFWGAFDDQGYYKRSSDYLDIVFRHQQGVHRVPMIHSAILLHMNARQSVDATFIPPQNYSGPPDDIIMFAQIAQLKKLDLYVDNSRFYGYIPPQIEDSDVTLDDVAESYRYMLLEIMQDTQGEVFPVASPHLSKFGPFGDGPIVKSTFGFDKIFMINLERRTDRRARMDYAFDLLGIDAEYVPAVDGSQLNDTYLESIGVTPLEGFQDPYRKRAMTWGEIGCFLSHYFLWKQMVEKNYSKILIFEDDIRFHRNFVDDFWHALDDLESHPLLRKWDLVYVGRKIMTRGESFVSGLENFVHPEYTYWTLSYMITRQGVEKLLAQHPLSRMVPVDEFLPIMFDKHPKDDLKNRFSPRDVVAFSINPLLLEPTHYTGEPFYISDTEHSKTISVNEELIDQSAEDDVKDVNSRGDSGVAKKDKADSGSTKSGT